MTTYRIVRFFQRSCKRRIIMRHLTREEAQEHCCDINTSSSTCWTTSALRRTRLYGPWFDGYEEE